MYPLIKTNSRYAERAEAISEKMRKYTNDSFLNCLFSHFQTYIKHNNITMNFPWCCFLALKWKFSAEQKTYASDMSQKDFTKIINKIYQLTEDAVKFESEAGVILEMRRMIINQTFYQTRLQTFALALSRQYSWYCKSDTPFFRDNFKSLTGLELDNYYKIAFFLTFYFQLDKNSESSLVNIDRIIIFLVPLFGVDEVHAFLKLVSIRRNEIKDFVLLHAREGWNVEEYFERTPFLYKPLILEKQGLVVLSKTVMNAGFSAIVPELFNENLKGKYGEKFGKIVERYLEKLLIDTFSTVVTEKELNKIYRDKKRTGKVVDYLIQDDDAKVFIDSKAVMPHRHLRDSIIANQLKNKLKDNLLEGLEKGQFCASIINGIEKRKPNPRDSLIIILQQDHYVSTGKFISSFINKDIFKKIISDLGDLPIHEDRIYYITIDEFENLLEACSHNHISITEIIDRCVENDHNQATQKMNFQMHIDELLPPKSTIHKDLLANHDEFLKVYAKINYASKIWDGGERAYNEIRKQLLSGFLD